MLSVVAWLLDQASPVALLGQTKCAPLPDPLLPPMPVGGATSSLRDPLVPLALLTQWLRGAVVQPLYTKHMRVACLWA